jgi:nitrate/TMAO reductase-like tetraheme cytochrome c subunit
MNDVTNQDGSGPAEPRAERVEAAAATRWAQFRLAALRVVAELGAFLFVSAVLGAFASVYTSRPEFCRSCHIMEPYYVSWQESTHRHVSCVKCHFPPGVGEKIRGKTLGLLQLAKYVTSTEGPRPAAEVPDASCLRSGCHETRLLAGKVDFNGIPFDHTPHLQDLRRGKKLRCTSCHSQIVQGSHMAVTASTCFLCHFKDQPFNQGLGTCTRCHQIPDKSYDLGGGATFDHEMAYVRGVECASCHGDLVRGQGEVPRERCTVCHNREHDLERFDDHEFVHVKHVTDHKVDCLDCHLTIHHAKDPDRIAHAVADCASCHPNQHLQQMDMLLGTGAKTVPDTPNAMVNARITCASCHQTKTVTADGDVLWTASSRTCSYCHDSTVVDRLWEVHATLRESLEVMARRATQLRHELESGRAAGGQREELEQQLSDIEDDVKFLRVGNGIHNIHYAKTLTVELVSKLNELGNRLQLEPIELTLPAHIETEGGLP